MAGTEHTQFALVTNARSGSTMFIQALNSHAQVRCFGAVFNHLVDFVDYDVDGYDDHDAAGLRLRNEEPVRFLRERIFAAPGSARAVGFKYRYGQAEAFPGLIDVLVADGGLRILHLKRRNRLRSLASAKVVQATGVWFAEKPPAMAARFARKVSVGNALLAVRHPSRALGALRRVVSPPPPPWKVRERPKLTLSIEECREYFDLVGNQEQHYDGLFAAHTKLEIEYQDLATDLNAALAPVHDFLGVAHQDPRVTLQRQNPEPLSQLIANYDELREAFRDTPHAAYFDD